MSKSYSEKQESLWEFLIYSPTHVYLFGCDQRQRTQQSATLLTQRLNSIVPLQCGGFGIHEDADTIWNELYTARACRLAIGNTIELSKYVLDGKLKNGFALVRPPGHHASKKPLGFCYFNTIAITAKYLKKHRNLQRIAIVDWDIHHGNGTQDLTYDDPNILYISLHRYDNGTYFPGGGRIEEVCWINKIKQLKNESFIF
jgi:histone deacetylase 4/5